MTPEPSVRALLAQAWRVDYDFHGIECSEVSQHKPTVEEFMRNRSATATRIDNIRITPLYDLTTLADLAAEMQRGLTWENAADWDQARETVAAWAARLKELQE